MFEENTVFDVANGGSFDLVEGGMTGQGIGGGGLLLATRQSKVLVGVL